MLLDNSTIRRRAVINLILRGIEADFVNCIVALPGRSITATVKFNAVLAM